CAPKLAINNPAARVVAMRTLMGNPPEREARGVGRIMHPASGQHRIPGLLAATPEDLSFRGQRVTTHACRPVLLDLAVAFRIWKDPGGVAQPGQSSGFISRVSLVQIQSPLLCECVCLAGGFIKA